jgi:hypothetical protein
MGRPRTALKLSRAVGGWALIFSSIVGAVAGALVAPQTLTIATRLSGNAWRSPRYWDWDLQIYDTLATMLAGAILFARLAQIANGVIAWLFGYRVLLGRPYWWDLLVLGVPLGVWGYLTYVANAEWFYKSF